MLLLLQKSKKWVATNRNEKIANNFGFVNRVKHVDLFLIVLLVAYDQQKYITLVS